VYMWSGIHKLSPWSADVFTDFYDAFTLTRPLVHWGWAAYLPAALEICTGVLLLFSRTRRWGAVLATILHLYIVVLLSPLGLNWNAVVIPWNFAMTALVWAFSMTKFPPFTPLHWSGKWMIAVPLGLAALGPLLNFWGKWPETFSWKMYSNTQPEATLVYTSEGAPCPAMAAAWAKYAHHKGYLLLDDWAMDNLGTPPFNHLRLYQQVARRVRQCAEQPDSLQLQWLQVSPWNHRLPPAQNVPF
jgi:hypothetical protein